MNDQLQAALVALLSRTTNGIDSGVAFLQAQLPEVIQQLLVWKATYSFLRFLFAMALASAILYFYARVYRWARKPDADWDDRPELGVLLLVTAFMWVIPAATFSLDWLQIIVAPKLYLIEYAAQIAK